MQPDRPRRDPRPPSPPADRRPQIEVSSDILRSRFQSRYEDLRSDADAWVSVPAAIAWSPNNVVELCTASTIAPRAIASALTARAHVGIREARSGGIRFVRAEQFDPHGNHFSPVSPSFVKTFGDRAFLDRLKREGGGDAEISLLNDAIGGRLCFDVEALNACAIATGWLLFVGTLAPADLASFASDQIDVADLLGKPAFARLFGLACDLERMLSRRERPPHHLILASLTGRGSPVWCEPAATAGQPPAFGPRVSEWPRQPSPIEELEVWFVSFSGNEIDPPSISQVLTRMPPLGSEEAALLAQQSRAVWESLSQGLKQRWAPFHRHQALCAAMHEAFSPVTHEEQTRHCDHALSLLNAEARRGRHPVVFRLLGTGRSGAIAAIGRRPHLESAWPALRAAVKGHGLPEHVWFRAPVATGGAPPEGILPERRWAWLWDDRHGLHYRTVGAAQWGAFELTVDAQKNRILSRGVELQMEGAKEVVAGLCAYMAPSIDPKPMLGERGNTLIKPRPAGTLLEAFPSEQDFRRQLSERLDAALNATGGGAAVNVIDAASDGQGGRGPRSYSVVLRRPKGWTVCWLQDAWTPPRAELASP